MTVDRSLITQPGHPAYRSPEIRKELEGLFDDMRSTEQRAERNVGCDVGDATLVVTVHVYPDKTDTRLKFGSGVRFNEGVTAVEQAVAAIRAEHSERSRCPAGSKNVGQDVG